MDKPLSHKVGRLSRMELPGAGQVCVTGNTAYVGHITNRAQPGTSILDVSDPKEPRLLAQVKVEEPDSHGLGRKGVVDGSAEQTGYDHGGFKIYDVSNRAKPKFITHVKTWGRGVHRFDMDEKYAYLSTANR